ncbi:MAG: ABC transporter permease subunit [Planctomycetaceae bacterium]|nr:ABC transporter permease subunit [Planctomycetaceae bacterium]
MLRFDVREIEKPVLAETVDLLGGRGGRLEVLGTLIGKTSLVAGDATGRIGIWFPVRPRGSATPDGAVMAEAHVLEGAGSPVTAVSASERTRLLAAGFGDGAVRLFHITSNQVIGEGAAPRGPVEAVALTPKEDGIVAVAGGSFHRWAVRAPHPETTLASIFGKVWYEGDVEPTHSWQSTGGTDDFEPKYGLVPLIFGTLKATFYSMLIAVPLAVLGAIFTTEFLHPKVRARVKPTIELMASLPSVVLGFLAALIFAPWIEGRVPTVIASFGAIPFAVLLGAYSWQALPRPLALRMERWRLLFILATLPVGAGLAFLAGPLAEDVLFSGDVKGWLDGAKGGPAGGWFVLLLPFSALAVIAANVRWVNPRIAAAAASWGRAREARFEMVRFLAGVAASVALSTAAAQLLGAAGLDPRGGFVDTYVQRNALVVGVVMGFAVIPIIYTLSEDALSSVPEHLRAASLAVGATRWQTAVNVILPTAMSGLFSALMIGLGRAVGETMVVLMAAGNTPVLEWNVFNGFRTLSANIAVELPEAVQDSTTYRMLFLAALTLFSMTFVVNTLAESVRQRFRKRAFEL